MVGRTKSEKAPKSGRFRTANSGHLRTLMQNVIKLIKCTLGLVLPLSLSLSLSLSIPLFADGGVMQVSMYLYEATIGLKDPSVWPLGSYPQTSSVRNILTRHRTRPSWGICELVMHHARNPGRSPVLIG